MDPRVSQLIQQFQQYMNITRDNFMKVQQKLAQQDMEIAGLKAALQQRNTPAAMNGAPEVTPEEEVVGMHPVHGTPVTRAMLAADPKLKLRMMFSENDA